MAKDITLIDAQTATSGSGTISMQNYDHAIIHAKCTTGGDFDLAVTVTPTEISGDTGVSIVPAGTDVTDISDIMLETGSTGAAKITVSYSNLSNNSVSAHTITAATGYVDGSNVNTNSTLTTDAGPRTGTLTRALTGLNCAPGADINRLTAAASSFNAADTGRNIVIAGSGTAGNNGTYAMTHVSGTAVDLVPDLTAPDTQVLTPAMTAIITHTVVNPDLAPGADINRITGAASSFHAGDTGRNIVIAGSGTAGNNGTYAMTHVSGTQIDTVPDLDMPDTQVITPGLTAIITHTVVNPDLAPGGDLSRLHTAAAQFAADDVGRTITITGSSTGGNNGTYTIDSFVDDQNVELTPDLTATDAGGGTLVVVMTSAISTVVLAPGADLSRLHTAAAQFDAGDVGRTITISGAVKSANNGTYTIDSFVDDQNVELTPDLDFPDPGGGTLAVVMTSAKSTVALAPGTDYTKITSGSDMFSTYDPGRTIVIASGANAGTYTVDTFTSATEIDVVETFPAITTGTAGTLTGTITGIDTAPGGDVDRVHTATAQFSEVDEGATLSIAGSTWPITVYVRLWSEGEK